MGNQASELSQASDDQTRQRSIQRIDSQVSQKFGKTTNWHLKVVIRGDRGTGKTSLFHRLQGKPFPTEYTPTETLQSAKVSWNYRTSHDVVNLEVWDVVDAPKIKKASSSGLKLSTSSNGGSTGLDDEDYDGEPGSSPYDEVDLDTVPVAGKTMSPTGKSTLGNLDSSNVDVLRGTHAVVLLFNPFKKWTWEYVKREIGKIPSRIQVLVMANFKDQSYPSDSPQSFTSNTSSLVSQIDPEDVRTYIELLDRPVYFLEASMQNCYGLKGLKTFLNLPFLLLQREVIETQLKQNQRELETAEEEYRLTADSESYESYLLLLNTRSTARASATVAEGTSASTTKPEGSSVSSRPTASPASSPTTKASKSTSSKSSTTSAAATSTSTTKKVPEARKQDPPKPKPEEPEEGGFMSRFFGKKNDKEIKPTAEDKKAVEELRRLKEGGATSGEPGDVDDFVPDSDGGWLDDDEDTPVMPKAAPTKPTPHSKIASARSTPADDSDDDDRPNPAIADYADELDDTDQLMMEALAKARAEKAKSASAKKVTTKPIIATPTPADEDDDDDDVNPALAAYEEDLDFDDAQIKGKPAPKIVTPVSAAPAKPSTTASKVASKASLDDSDSDDDGPNPGLAGYSEDIDFDDMMTSPSQSSGSVKVGSLASSGAATPTHFGNSTSMPKLTAPIIAAHTPAYATPSASTISSSPQNSKITSPTSITSKTTTAAKAKPKAVLDSDSDSDADNSLVAKDESDSDDDYAGFVPKKTASTSLGSSTVKSASSSISDLSSIPDFNPLEASNEADSDAFWANARAPPPRKPSTAVTTPASNATVDPFAFGSGASTPISSSNTSPKERKDKDKHKHKHHKDKKDKHRKESSNTASPSSASHYPVGTLQGQPAQQAMYGGSYNQPPVATTPPPSAAPKKSVFYL